MGTDKHERLVDQALQLKKARLVVIAILCEGRQLTQKDLVFPNYFGWKNNALKRHISDLELDLDEVAKRAFLAWKRSSRPAASAWLAERFDEWQEVEFGLLDLGRVHEVEKVLGPLVHRRSVDCPPYAQVLLQGFNCSAIRHPEYHLARDLALLYNLLLDAEAVMDEARRRKQMHSSEHSQSLARMVILTCFNLLESFASGLATGWLIENPNAPEEKVNALRGKKPKGKDMSLRERFCSFPAVITGKPNLDDSQAPLLQLFGQCKQRRDSFVHCEPGPDPTKWGYIKEKHFHDADLAVATNTVELTCQAICLAWKTVHGKDKPSWLPIRDSSGRFPSVHMVLRSNDPEIIPTNSKAA